MTRQYWVATFATAGVLTAPLWAEEVRSSYSSYGTPGLVETPTATSFPDAELTATVFSFGNTTRTTVGFQVLPDLHGAFRYSAIEGLGNVRDNLYDRSFDLHYQLVNETNRRPGIAIGLRDFIGTGIYSSEYVVATKSLNPRLSVTAGIGWGRLSESDEILRRRDDTDPLGGQVEAGNWFQGDAALFGGVAWQATPDLQLKLEYSPDTYAIEEGRDLITRDSQVNVGLDYRVSDAISLQAFYLYGDSLGASINVINNPKNSAAPSGVHAAPFPVRARAPGAGRNLGWVTDEAARSNTQALLATTMEREGMDVAALDLGPRAVTIHIRNDRYDAPAEAIGRTARILSQVMPDSVERFTIVPVTRDMPAASVTVHRRDVEQLEHAARGDALMLERATIQDAPAGRPTFDASSQKRLDWGLGPYLRTSYFDPDRPVRVDAGLRLSADVALAPGLFLSGSARQSLAGNIDEGDRESDSVLPRVRSESTIYDREGELALERLTADFYFKPGATVFGRFSAGYLEEQFGGLSAEMLWKPVQRPFALGAEVNHVRQRDFDMAFGFRDYDVTTGHVSGYWDMGNGFHTQVDAGRYLAGDWGSTVALDREFDNGWKIGAYATLTDVSFEDFGEGSFDKGVRITIPLSPLLGKPTRQKFQTTLQPITRDGGARVHVSGRLYETVREYHLDDLEGSWGRFWR